MRRGREGSVSKRSKMWLVASAIGTEGKRAVASKEVIISCGRNLSFLVFFNKFERVFTNKGVVLDEGFEDIV